MPAASDLDLLACACGCGIFDVGDINSMIPMRGHGGMAWLRWSYMSQSQNWQRSHAAPATDNDDRLLATSFITAGGQYTFSPRWTVMAELPMYDRQFNHVDDGTVAGPAGTVFHTHLFALGDAMVMGNYTGLQKNMSTGLQFGVKLPTGLSTSRRGPLGGTFMDRDTLPGTGSFDFILGAYHVGSFMPNGQIPYWVQLSYRNAFTMSDQYRAGNETDTALGVGYSFGKVWRAKSVTPSLQLLGSWRARDSGLNADPLNSGYSKLLVAPGIQVDFNRFNVYADVELPIFQYVNSATTPHVEGSSGQLVAPVLFKVQVGYDF
jgi:hypothetical protein